MRALITGIGLISLSFLMLPVSAPAFAQEVCRCQGCGCKGGPGWRGPEGTCVSKAKLAEICGSPPGAPCKQEAASGTVLFPRIVVTAAHCLQHKARWPGGLVYIDEYAQAAELTVAVTRGEKTETYDVAEVTISPAWRSEVSASNTVAGSNRNQRFAHDIALVVTKEPIAVGLPPSLIKLAAGDGLAPEDISCASKSAAAQGGTQARDAALRDMLEKRLGHHAVLVALGAENCTPRFCGEAGVRRYQNITLKESAECFVNRGSRASPPTPSGDTAVSPSLAVWCMESNVLPGDSGGALLVEGPRGELYYLGVISAQQGRSLALASSLTQKRSVATALYPSLDFILEEARKLGYAR